MEREGNRMRRILSRLFATKNSRQTPFAIATEEDLYYCYRLILRREPDEPGWNQYKELLKQQVSIQMLVDGFLHSSEFRRLQEEGFRPRLVALDRFQMFVRPNDFFVGAVIANDKVYEAYVTDEIGRLLQTGMVFVDIGANIGYFTLLAAVLVGPEGRVIAFEPNPDNCDLLQQSIAANGFDNISLHPYAVAESEQEFQLDVGGTSSNGRVIDFSSQAVPGDGPPRLIRAVALDHFLVDEPRIDVIKMDIEGAEPRALQGMEQIIARHRPVLITEFSPHLIEVTSHMAPAAFLQLLHHCGYDIFVLERDAAKSAAPQSQEQLLQAYADSGLTHLDLVAYPRS
jgi:FkbM family methyltransferase